MLHLGILKTWNSTDYTAGVQLAGSLTTYLDDINVASNIAPEAMIVGNYVLIAIPEGNPRDACVIASWPEGSSGGGGGGVTDHGELTGLGDDDHPQYLNVARHDLTARHPLGTVVPHEPALNNITNVNVPTPADNDVLYWDNAASQWKCKAPVGGAVTEHGADKHTNVTRYLWIPAVVGYAGTGTVGYQYYYSTVSGGANEIAPTVYWTLKAPSDFVSLVSVKALWASPVASGNMYWKTSAYYGAAGENIGAHNDWPAYGTTATAGNMKWNLQEPAHPLTLSSLTKDDFIGIRFIRVGSDPSDTLENTVYLAGLLFTYIAEQ